MQNHQSFAFFLCFGSPQGGRARHFLLLPLAGVIVWATLSLTACEYGRMMDDEAIHTFERPLPEMPRGTIPTHGGIQILRTADPRALLNPIPESPEAIDRGRERYGFYCVQCHGTRGDGYGTVGQSFAPLPVDLKSAEVRKQSDGEIFYRVSLGYKRHPPLWDTVSEEDRWALIRYIRSLAEQTGG